MALIFVDAFVRYTTKTEMAKRGWTIGSGSSFSPTGSRFGGGALAVGSGTETSLSFQTAGRLIFQMAFVPQSFGGSDYWLIYNNSGADLCLQIEVSPAGALVVKDAATAVIYTGPGGQLSPATFHTIAVEADIGSDGVGPGTGIVRIWLDQPSSGATPIVNLANVDLRVGSATTADKINFGTGAHTLSDFILYDSSGATQNVYLGDKRLYAVNTVAETADQAWTPQTGADNAVMVGTAVKPLTAAASSATYNSAAAVPRLDLYTYDDIPLTATGIVAVVVELEASKTDAGAPPGAFKARIDDGLGTGLDGPVHTLLWPTYRIFQSFFLDVPGGVGWTATQVNDAVAGPKVV